MTVSSAAAVPVRREKKRHGKEEAGPPSRLMELEEVAKERLMTLMRRYADRRGEGQGGGAGTWAAAYRVRGSMETIDALFPDIRERWARTDPEFRHLNGLFPAHWDSE